MNRRQAIASIETAIAKATGHAREVLKAHRAKMVEGFAKEDAALAVRIAARKQQTMDWQSSLDFHPH